MTTEHFDVLVVGAGLSGIGAGHYLQAECPWASYSIFEARGSIGGTWDLFRYPGLRSDSDMFTLGYAFKPWSGTKAIADGPDILSYIRETAAEEGIERHVRFHHRVTRAEWSSHEALWRVTAERTDTGEKVEVTCGFLFSCSGYYRYDRGYEPRFPGAESFAGRIVHPQHWDEALDYEDKQVVVIGSGATAVTLVPALAKKARHVTMLQRSPSYIVAAPAVDPLANLLRRVLPKAVSGPLVRWMKALTTQGVYRLSRRHPKLVAWLLRQQVKRLLPRGYDVDTHFRPRYDPWDQRLCLAPNGDLFEAIRQGRVSVVTDHIERFNRHGILLRSGRELEADIVVTATGLELLFLGGMEVLVDGEPLDVSKRLVYKGMMLEGVPNLAVAVGYTNASWTLKCDLTCRYVCRLLNHMRATGTRICVPVNRDSAVQPEPLLPLSSGYIKRAADRFPKQGSRFPWRVYQSYLQDYRALELSPLEDGVMVFSRPLAEGELAAAS